jgi:hypothetical protein
VIPDLAVVPGPDLSTVKPIDLAVPVADLAHPPPPPDLTVPLIGPDFSDFPVFTDGFENGILGSLWTTTETGGNVGIDPNKSHRGFYSLHVHENALSAGGSAQVTLVETTAVPLPDLFVRVFVFVPSGSDPTSVGIVTVQQAAAAHRGIRLNLEQGSFSSTNNVPSSVVSFTATSPVMPTDQWVCLEWHIQAAANGSAHAFVDGTEVTALSGAQALQPSPPLGAVGIGLVASPSTSTAARDIWFDDVFIDASPVGCAK